MNCPNCNFQNPGNYRFCGHCGDSLNPKSEIEPEYRNLTVMFCDIVGSTVLSRNLEPEDFHSLIKQYQETCRKIVESYSGYVSQYLGDGVLIYFGFPVAKEDDPRRAVIAGLEIIRDIKRSKQLPFKVRIGINTGRVIIADVGSKSKSDPIAIGNVPNTAAMIQKLSRENEVLIGDDTRLLVEGYFELRRIRKSGLIVNDAELPLYRVISARNNLTRFQVKVAKGLSPFVGRENELNRLNDELLKAVSGQCRIVSINGEAGIGKSRLIHEFKNSIDTERHRVIECQCWEIRRNSPFAPIVELLERKIGFDEKDTNNIKIRKLEDFLTKHKFNLEQNIPVIASLFSLHITKKYSMPIVTPEKIRQDLLNRLSELFLKIGNGKNPVFVIEDVHWADPSTLELLILFLKSNSNTGVLMIISHRPGLENELLHNKHVSQMNLKHFNKTESKKLISLIFNKNRNESKSVEEIISRSAGVPLFIEELTKASLGKYHVSVGGGVNNSSNSIPVAINGYLAEKLDKLGHAKKVAQYASVIGTEFDLDVLKSIKFEEDDLLSDSLNTLIDSDIIYPLGDSRNGKYIFKHSLIRDAAYDQLSTRNRKGIHKKITQTLEGFSTNISESQPEILAYHYDSAGLYQKAIDYYYRAGFRDINRPAYIEALHHLEAALDLIKYLPYKYQEETELQIKTLMLNAYLVIYGINDDEIFDFCINLFPLAQKSGKPEYIFPVAQLLCHFYITAGELNKVIELCEQLLSLAKSNEIYMLTTSAILALPYFLSGNTDTAFQHWNVGLEIYKKRDYEAIHGFVDPGLICMAESSCCLLLSGFPDNAQVRMEESIKIADKRINPIELPYVRTMNLIMHAISGDVENMTDFAKTTAQLCKDRGINFYGRYATILEGYHIVCNGELEPGIYIIEDVFNDIEKSAAALPLYMSFIAEAYKYSGRYSDSIQLVDEAYKLATKTRFKCIIPNLYRVKADSMLKLHENNLEEIKTLYRKAISSSRKMKFKLYELQATVGLCRVLRDEGRTEEAYKMLSGVYGWFTEGFDTRHIREAKALLDELGH